MVLLRNAAVALLLAAAVVAGPKTRRGPPSPESMWVWLLRFTGITATSSRQRGQETEPGSGTVWIKELSGSASIRLSSKQYRSPVFDCVGNRLFVLSSGGGLFFISAGGGDVHRLGGAPGVVKLVGIERHRCIDLLGLLANGQPVRVSTRNGGVQPIKLQKNDDLAAVRGYLGGDERNYGAVSLYTEQAKSGGMTVVLGDGHGTLKVATCRKRCSAPTLSPDRMHVAWIDVP
jgi:hypothetical protein